jgi:hypothetical protein
MLRVAAPTVEPRVWDQALATAVQGVDGVEVHRHTATVDARQTLAIAKVASSHPALSRRRLLHLRHPQHPALSLPSSA